MGSRQFGGAKSNVIGRFAPRLGDLSPIVGARWPHLGASARRQEHFEFGAFRSRTSRLVFFQPDRLGLEAHDLQFDEEILDRPLPPRIVRDAHIGSGLLRLPTSPRTPGKRDYRSDERAKPA
jgi:hypothetical protein